MPSVPTPCPTDYLRHCLLGVALSLFVAGCGSTHTATRGEVAVDLRSEPKPDATFRALPHQAYTPDDWPETLEARVYLPDTSGGALRPAALIVHGGGWQNRTPDDMTSIAESLAQEGYVAVNIEHRFAPDYRFPAQLHDLQQAMAWLHDNAPAWRVDTDRIVGVGFSSGAQLVSLLAVSGAEGPLASPYGGDHARLAAVLAGGTPSDLLKFDDGRLVVDFLGGTRAEVPEQYRLASPARQVTTDTPPFFLFHGTWDQLVPVDHATDFKAELEAKGVETELYLQHWRGHLASFLTKGGAIDAGIAFLNRQVNGH